MKRILYRHVQPREYGKGPARLPNQYKVSGPGQDKVFASVKQIVSHSANRNSEPLNHRPGSEASLLPAKSSRPVSLNTRRRVQKPVEFLTAWEARTGSKCVKVGADGG